MGPENQVLYSRDRALVRVHGVEFAIPNDDRALIVLIDETARDVEATIKTDLVSAPTSPWFPLDPRVSEDEHRRQRRERVHAAGTVWQSWIEHEPFIAAFVAEHGRDTPAGER